MTSNERQKKIIRLLDKRRKDTMEHLSIEFHVSTDTISRDIATLNEDYPIKIVRGRNGGLSLGSLWLCQNHPMGLRGKERTCYAGYSVVKVLGNHN